ncbi:50S ribosomal protein L17 [Atopobium fossor]|uniref:50S ribosomal protein L17 n=1 Tax=Atopobium fossor TaxID=39487 RepID=UPI00041AD93C|nr:50S ribosomal protein L17 [Atopobium fossor]
MRHNKKRGMKLGTDASHTKAIKKGLVCALLANDRIKTTQERAKAIRPDVDRVITWAKRGDLAARRNAIAKLGDAALVSEVFDKAAQGMWADRNGGYTRIMKLGARKGDNAEVVIIELVNEPVAKKAAKPAATVKKVAKVEEKVEEPAVETQAEAAESETVEAAEPEATDAE